MYSKNIYIFVQYLCFVVRMLWYLFSILLWAGWLTFESTQGLGGTYIGKLSPHSVTALLFMIAYKINSFLCHWG